MLKYTVETAPLRKQLKNLDAAIQAVWWKRFAPTAEGLLVREQNRHFQSSSGPNGEKWPPLSQITLQLSQGQADVKVNGRKQADGTVLVGTQKTATVRRTAGSKPLLNTGLLRASVTAGGNGAIRQTGNDFLLYGTNLPYAKIQQFGGTIDVTAKMRGFLYATTGVWLVGQKITIPARPFLGTSAKCREELAKGAGYVLQQVIKEAL